MILISFDVRIQNWYRYVDTSWGRRDSHFAFSSQCHLSLASVLENSCLYFSCRNRKFGVWIQLGVTEWRILFLCLCDIDLSTRKIVKNDHFNIVKNFLQMCRRLDPFLGGICNVAVTRSFLGGRGLFRVVVVDFYFRVVLIFATLLTLCSFSTRAGEGWKVIFFSKRVSL